MKKTTNSILISILMFLGFVLRINQYLYKSSIWQDEAVLALNIINRSFFGLFKPLSFDQSAPAGFLVLIKIMVNFFGNNEYSLRFFTLFAALTSIVLFYFLGKRFLLGKNLIFALMFFVFSTPLITYSNMLKQYSVDLAVGLALYIIFLQSLNSRLNIRKFLILTCLGLVSIWFSQTAVIILASLGLYIFFALLRKKKIKELSLYLVIFATSIASFFVNYKIVLQPAISNPNLKNFWNYAFAPWPFWSNLDWYKNNFIAVFRFPLGLNSPIIGLALFVLGGFYFYKDNKKNFTLLILPILITLFLSMFKLYPFTVRFLIFLTPFFYIFIAYGLGKIFSKKNIVLFIIGVIFLLIIAVPLVLKAANDFGGHPVIESNRPVMEYYLGNRQPGDALYIYYGATAQYKYYLGYFKAKSSANTIYGVDRMKGVDVFDYVQDINKLRGRKRIWIFFSHDMIIRGVDEQDFFVNYLDSIGKRLDSYSRPGTKLYLYDLRQK